MADAAAARDEDHRHWRKPRQEKGVVIGAADHLPACSSRGGDRFLHRLQYRDVTTSWWVGVHSFEADLHAAPRRGLARGTLELLDHAVTPGSVCVANVGFQPDEGRNGVHSAWEDLTDPDGGNRIDNAGRSGGGFERQNQFRSSAKGVMPVRHEHRSGMAAFTLDGDPQRCRCGNMRDNAQIQSLAFQQRALLDMEFHKGMKMTLG